MKPQAFPSIINLPNGHQPEGIAIGQGNTFYVGSLANGSVYRGDLRTGAGDILVPGVAGPGADRPLRGRARQRPVCLGCRQRAGLRLRCRHGGDAGDVSTGGTGTPTFVNDVVVTGDAAYFTDSFQPVLYRVPLGPQGALPDQSAVERIPLSGDFVFVPGGFNANGIEASSDGRWLLIVNSTTGDLYRVDPQTGEAALVDLGGASLTAGDGLRLQGQTLYVVRNQLNQIVVIRLNRDWTSGAVEGTITDPNFDVPTTLGLFGDSLYAVNARFTTPPTPDTPYTVVQVSRVP